LRKKEKPSCCDSAKQYCFSCNYLMIKFYILEWREMWGLYRIHPPSTKLDPHYRSACLMSVMAKVLPRTLESCTLSVIIVIRILRDTSGTLRWSSPASDLPCDFYRLAKVIVVLTGIVLQTWVNWEVSIAFVDEYFHLRITEQYLVDLDFLHYDSR
jgi:hypothetical protein